MHIAFLCLFTPCEYLWNFQILFLWELTLRVPLELMYPIFRGTGRAPIFGVPSVPQFLGYGPYPIFWGMVFHVDAFFQFAQTSCRVSLVPMYTMYLQSPAGHFLALSFDA